MRKACYHYGIDTTAFPRNEEVKMCKLIRISRVPVDDPDLRRDFPVGLVDDTRTSGPDMVVEVPTASWTSIRRQLFAHTAHVARESGDMTSAARCIAGLLRLYGELAARDHKVSSFDSGLSTAVLPEEGVRGILYSKSQTSLDFVNCSSKGIGRVTCLNMQKTLTLTRIPIVTISPAF
jgi:hypothetical protein